MLELRFQGKFARLHPSEPPSDVFQNARLTTQSRQGSIAFEICDRQVTFGVFKRGFCHGRGNQVTHFLSVRDSVMVGLACLIACCSTPAFKVAAAGTQEASATANSPEAVDRELVDQLESDAYKAENEERFADARRHRVRILELVNVKANEGHHTVLDARYRLARLDRYERLDSTDYKRLQQCLRLNEVLKPLLGQRATIRYSATQSFEILKEVRTIWPHQDLVLAKFLGVASQMRAALHEYEEAENLREEALTCFESSLGAQHPATAECLANLADIWHSRGAMDAAFAGWKQASDRLEGAPEFWQSSVIVRLRWAWALVSYDKALEASQVLNAAEKTAAAHGVKVEAIDEMYPATLARVQARLGFARQSEAVCRDLLKSFQSRRRKSFQIDTCRFCLLDVLRFSGDDAKALALVTSMIQEASFESYRKGGEVTLYIWEGELQARNDRIAEAERAYQRAMEAVEPGGYRQREVLLDYAKFFATTGRNHQAIDCQLQAHKLPIALPLNLARQPR